MKNRICDCSTTTAADWSYPQQTPRILPVRPKPLNRKPDFPTATLQNYILSLGFPNSALLPGVEGLIY
jgi:hypothetical protein